MRTLVFDTETTGFKTTSRVIELGLICVEDGRIVDEWGSMFYPPDTDWTHPDVLGAFKVNGLSEEALRGSPHIKDHLEFIANELEIHDTWAGHNISFDIRMLRQEFERYGRKFPEPRNVFDTMRVVERRLGRKYKLTEVAPMYSVTLTDAHEAVADARATAEVYLEMVKKGHVM